MGVLKRHSIHPLAKRVHPTTDQEVGGSNPPGRANLFGDLSEACSQTFSWFAILGVPPGNSIALKYLAFRVLG